ncbi:Protein app1 [Wickerhamiella sorbophila]|uniref:Protein app1 n=1 Tax=Wickerhamiella sorbophila TaxID=45607 RepID=A0A2T0FJE6_9ASCO|nr:Protein app1 [Wickerhamiella sorbophila]PRT55059.1 Protein app1 [Wickerhamiella sorbophila]
MSYAIDLSSHGRELKRIYESIVTSDPDTTWAVFNYQGSAKHTLVPGATGDGDLRDFVEEFDDNKVQYGLARVEYSGVNKVVLVGWVGESVPERVKGYFNAHFSTIAKYFDGYHVQVTARSSDDLTPSIIMSKIDSAAGSKYSGATRTLSTKPKYRAAQEGADEDDWGDAKPVVERDLPNLDKVSSAYKPTKIDIGEIRKQASKSRSEVRGVEGLDSSSSYKPVGKIDIKAIREAGKNSKYADTRVEKIESSYKPVGKVDIKAIREQAKKQESHKKSINDDDDAPTPAPRKTASRNEPEWVKKSSSREDNDDDNQPAFGSLADRMKAFNSGVQSARPQDTQKTRIASAKAKFDKKHASGTLPLRVDESHRESRASSGFKDYGSTNGKTPAQLWAEKHGKRDSAPKAEEPESDHDDNVSDEDVDMAAARAKFANVRVEEERRSEPIKIEREEKASFSDFTRKFAQRDEAESDTEPEPKLPPRQDEPKLPPRQAEPKLTPRQVQAEQESEPEPEPERELPSRAEDLIVAIVEEAYDEDPAEDNEISLVVGEKITDIEKISADWWLGTNSSGRAGLFPAEFVRVVSGASDDNDQAPPPPARPVASEPEPEEEEEPTGGSAIAEYDYDAVDEDELAFREGDKITNIEFASDDWWSGEANGKVGLFPANHVKLL